MIGKEDKNTKHKGIRKDVVLAQRPNPATAEPTWPWSADLHSPLASQGQEPQEPDDTKRLIRQAIKQLEECMCAGSDGRRKNLNICDRLRAAISKTRGGEKGKEA